MPYFVCSNWQCNTYSIALFKVQFSHCALSYEHSCSWGCTYTMSSSGDPPNAILHCFASHKNQPIHLLSVGWFAPNIQIFQACSLPKTKYPPKKYCLQNKAFLWIQKKPPKQNPTIPGICNKSRENEGLPEKKTVLAINTPLPFTQ